MLTIATIVLGFFVISRIPVDLLPSITYPRIGLRVDAPGIVPEVGVNDITRPLEEAMAATAGVEQIFSQTREGRISIDLFFRPGEDIDQALNDATASLNRVRDQLPETIAPPRLFKFDPSQLPVYELALTSRSFSPVDLRIFADEELARELTRVPGVANVDISGGIQEEVQINLDLDRLQAVGLSINDVLAALRDRNQDTAGGLVRGGKSEALTRIQGKFGNADEIRRLPLTIADRRNSSSNPAENVLLPPAQIFLGDVATIRDGTAEQRIFVSLNGQPAVKVSIQKQPDANSIEVVDRVKAKLAELQRSGVIPGDMQLQMTLDESRFIRASIQNVTSAGLSGAALAALAVLLFLGSLRQTIIIVLAIPLATLGAMLLMGLFGLSLNVFSLGGLALGVGIVVDNAIVMLENITTHTQSTTLSAPISDDFPRENDREVENDSPNQSQNQTDVDDRPDHHSPLHDQNDTKTSIGTIERLETSPTRNPIATSPQNLLRAGERSRHVNLHEDQQQTRRQIQRQAEASSRELESALFASTITNLVSVVPFLLIGGFLSLLFNELILTISFAVAASLLIALTVVPALATRLLTIPYTSGLSQFFVIRGFAIGLQALTRGYQRVLRGVVRWRLLVIVLTVVSLGSASGWMVGQLPQEILPQINTGQAGLRVQFPPGTPIADNRRVMNAIDRILFEQPDIESVFTTAGGSLFGNVTSANALTGSSTISLKPGVKTAAFVGRMNAQFKQALPLVDTRIGLRPETVRGLILSNSPTRRDIDILLQGTDTLSLEQAGQQVLAALGAATLAEYEPDAEDPQPEVQVLPDWSRVADLELSAVAIGETIQTAINGTVATQLQRRDDRGDRLVDVRVQLTPGTVQRPEQLRNLPLFSNERQLIRVGDVATIQTGRAPGEIQRLNQRQIVLIEGTLADGASLSAALAEVDKLLSELTLPDGVSRLPSSAAATNNQLQSALTLLGSLATFLVFVVMAVQYNSLIDPLVILLTVPLALAGGILGLYVTQMPVGATVIIGVVLLVGIVVNNAIIMVELANQLRESDRLSPREAILQAAPQRLRPILMTTITTVLGLLPLAIGGGEGSEFLQPLGVVVFSGLSLATLLTLFIIPCFYVLFHPERRRDLA